MPPEWPNKWQKDKTKTKTKKKPSASWLHYPHFKCSMAMSGCHIGSADTESVQDCWSRTLHTSLLPVLIFPCPESLAYRALWEEAREVFPRPLRGSLASSGRPLLTVCGLLGRAKVRSKAEHVPRALWTLTGIPSGEQKPQTPQNPGNYLSPWRP